MNYLLFASFNFKDFFNVKNIGEDWAVSAVFALLILLLTLLIRGTLVKLLFKFLERISKKSSFKWDNIIVEQIKRPMHYAIMLLGIVLACLILPLSHDVSHVLLRVFKVCFIILIGYTVYSLEAFYLHVFSNFGKKLSNQNSQILNLFFLKTLRFVIIALTIVLVLDVFGFNVSTFIAGLGISGLAFALAAQDTLSNLIAGVTLIFDKPFEVGDRIQTNGIDGIVDEISFRTTRLKTINQEFVTIPNKNIANNAVVNLFRIDHLRNATVIGCTYDTTADQLRQLVKKIRDMLENRSDVLPASILVSVQGFGASSIDVQVVFVTKTGTWSEFIVVREEINLGIMEVMASLEIEFAFPSQSIYFNSPLKIEKE